MKNERELIQNKYAAQLLELPRDRERERETLRDKNGAARRVQRNKEFGMDPLLCGPYILGLGFTGSVCCGYWAQLL